MVVIQDFIRMIPQPMLICGIKLPLMRMVKELYPLILFSLTGGVMPSLKNLQYHTPFLLIGPLTLMRVII